MIVAKQMQNAVDEQRENLLSQGVPSSPRLTLRGINRDDHISQKPGV